jgi:hypothetical protein
MRRLFSRKIAWPLLALLAGANPAASADGGFTIHGRLEQSNGAPSFRIWRAGTKRILGVLDCAGRDESPRAIPLNVQKVAGRYVSVPVFGDFTVCPLTGERRGWMQMVCIKRADHLRAEKAQ